MKNGVRVESSPAPIDTRRRLVLAGIALAPVALCSGSALAASGDPSAAARAAFLARIAQLERAHGGRLGVALRDVAGSIDLAHRGDERVLMCSTFKCLLAACVLHHVDAGRARLDRAIAVGKADLVSYSPVTEKAVGRTMTLGALCEATVTVSDNTAANLLLGEIGGPAALTRFARMTGDATTRLDRRETELNLLDPAHPERDTTTPRAMAQTLGRVLTGDVLSPSGRAQLLAWLRACSTGKARIRAGLPTGWDVGDKTGTGPTATNDVAWILPPGRAPVALAVYYVDAKGDANAQNAVIAEVARAAAHFLGA